MCLFNPSLIFPGFGEVWRCCISKCHLFEITPFAGWLEIANAIHQARIITPADLAPLSFSECAFLGEINASGAIPSYCGNRPYVGGAITLREIHFLSKRETESRNLIPQLMADSVDGGLFSKNGKPKETPYAYL